MNILKLKWHKLTHWEYWPMQAIYYPIFPIWAYFAIKAKSFFFFNAANPSIKNGGMAMESKKEIYDIIPEQYIPKTVFVKKNSTLLELLAHIDVGGLQFPLIVKPDVGMKAFGVQKVQDVAALSAYAEKCPQNFLIQELITYPKEIGLFYVRYPNSEIGAITGIVAKEFLTITGNGKETVAQLIAHDPRSALQRKSLKKLYGALWDDIPSMGKSMELVPFGSHTRGAKFLDISHEINDEMSKTINDICTQIHGFYFGRLDIRYASLQDLAEGKNFSIIEINGAGSEPTHIYDPKHSLLFAWKEIYRHWKMLYIISKYNKQKGHPYLSYREGTAMLRANSAMEAQLKLI